MNVEILPGCVLCGACSAINSDVFELTDETAIAHQDKINGNEIDCIDAAEACPVNVIRILD